MAEAREYRDVDDDLWIREDDDVTHTENWLHSGPFDEIEEQFGLVEVEEDAS